uniref:Eukaryotic translation initiation factor 4E binding protein 1 n=1 Tax=Buteo japonicus TaxID=224669 RepID=A0A8C0HG61_9AVES
MGINNSLYSSLLKGACNCAGQPALRMQKQMPVQEFLLGNGQSDIRRHCHVLLPDVYLMLVSTYSFQLLTTYKSTRIIYDRKFLMECRNSPVAKTPPSHLPDIPGVTSPNVEELKIENNHVQNCDEKVSTGEHRQKTDQLTIQSRICLGFLISA